MRIAKVRTAGILLGVGLGGFLDGIVLHEILGWHHMVSAAEPPTTVDALRTNVLADGLFHAFAWVVTLVGVFLLWRAIDIAHGRPPRGLLVGGLLVGWALFNLVEGLVDHVLLGIHHVREGPDATAWDLGFLAASAVLFVVGSSVLRRALREAPG